MPFLKAFSFLPLFLEAGGDAAEAAPSIWGTILQMWPLLAIIIIFYFFLIRPENKRKKQITAMRNELMVGDQITTIGGIVGTIINIKDDMLTIESGGDRSKIQLAKWAVSSKGEQTTETK
ncbi:preprotein translocase subunit YajC [Oscillospiraceae bacterium OttesenSCG-928-G22]|nr:preprotein translocase subunit YajC [Oscillospiraceae bacterium OttesenSCG-928-G22]